MQSVICESCGVRPATALDGEKRLCGHCSRRNAALPLLGASLAAVGLLAASAVVADRLRREGPPGLSPIDEFTRRLRGANTPTLASFSRDLTELAREGKLDPVVGRSEEIERVVAILARRSKNNPVLVGEPGVGKTAIVEGLAQRIAAGSVPVALRGKRVLALSLGPLVAGTKYRGEFESRVKRILDEVRRSARDVILFIDEMHALVGAGAAEGALDLSSMIKPELARGDLQCVGATTFDDYRKYVETDAALERRFQPVMVAEPSVAETLDILRGLRDRYATHHGVAISESALEAAAHLSARYIADRFLPDKAIDLVDESAAAVALRQRPGDPGGARVTAADVAAVVSKWTGIPVEAMTESQANRLLDLEETLGKRVVGQARAIAAVSEAIRRARAGLHDPSRPLGSFLFLGPSGVGKTELAKALSGALFGTDASLVRVDLSELSEAHGVSRLLGAPPGYAGHDEPGQLTEPVRRRPYCVVLFDELEGAHPDVAAILLQILDDGHVTDAKGRNVDFRHAIIILTTNLSEEETRIVLRPELINRIDEIVPFDPLRIEQIEEIVTIHVDALAHRLDTRLVRLSLTDEARRFLALESMSAGSGARYVGRTVARRISTPLSSAILRGEIHDGGTAEVDLKDGSIVLHAA
ncbi:MAG: ATP-dependent Clp protease ATP-binding subunit [Candidatus Tyrphobacter sp.]